VNLKLTQLAFFALALLTILADIFFFEIRYMWYVEVGLAYLLRGTLFVLLGAIIASWVAYPSRVLVATLAATSLLFPMIPGLGGVPPNTVLLVTVAVIAAMMAGATQLRMQGWKKKLS